jgi:hypothetical protein
MARPSCFHHDIGAWYTGTILLVFAVLGRMIVNNEYRANAHAA